MQKKHNAVTRAVAGFCHYCPLCEYARQYPESWVGRVLHHPLHADHCPAWKAEQEVYGRTPRRS